jgi:galactose mutarotase-like enzyme
MNESRCSIRTAQAGGLEAVVIENGLLRLTVVPQLGGKIVSLVRCESGHEFLLQPHESTQAYQLPIYGDRFGEYESSGFDDCLPTVAECFYPEEPFLSRQLPDHGDVWCLPAKVEAFEDQINLTTVLRSLPLRFTRTVRLQGNQVRLDYEATNLSESTVKFLWSAHPLLKVEPAAEIILPQEVREVEVAWSKDERLGKAGDRCPWPEATDCFGRPVELNRISSVIEGTAEKLFTPRLSDGFCGMFLPQANESIAFRFDTRQVPYIGIWICQGGWPGNRSTQDFTVALEPCNGRPDSLDDAIIRNECAVLAGAATLQWWLEIEVNSGPPRR